MIKLKITKDINAKHFGVSVGDIVELSFQEYLKGVVANEIGNAHIEACKAQAIASRTSAYPYYESKKAISDSSSSVQSFNASRMISTEYPNAHNAVETTAGVIQCYDDKALSPCSYSSSNGGKTTSSQSRWGGYRPYLIEQDDPWDYAATNGKKTGHGVGMSQEGAKYAAKTGISFKEILSFYYPNTTLKTQKGVEDSVAVKASYQVEKFKYMVDQGWDYVAGGASKGAVDCSGAFTYWYKQAGGYMYHGSNTMWRKYSTEKGKIGSITVIPGMAVYKWRNDGKEPSDYQSDGQGNFYHVGLYVGNDQVVEAKGTKYGVVYSSLSQWTHASKQKNTDYDMTEAGSDNSNSTSAFPIEGLVKTSGGALRVRSAPVDGDVLGKLANSTSISIIGETNGWYQINYKGHIGYISGDYVALSSSWKVTFNISNEDLKDEIISYLESKGQKPTIETIGG